jgi:DNA-binding transcriptional regulator YiaG
MTEKLSEPKITLMAARKNIGLTQVEAAKQLSVATSTLQSWERGITHPNRPEIDRLCSLYNLRYDCINFSPIKLSKS